MKRDKDNKNDFLSSTRIGIGGELLCKIQKTKFCIVGCGAVGSAFAEMLVRTGAQIIHLIDGDMVEVKNLNRLISFFREDVGEKKVEILERNLKRINSDITIKAIPRYLKSYAPDENDDQKTRDMVAKSGLVVIATDNNKTRIECETLCCNSSNINYLSIGVEINETKSEIKYECTWKPTTQEKHKEREGYGIENGSFASIVLEATAVGFNMMLHHLKNPGSKKFRKYYKCYKDYVPCISRQEQ